MLLCTGQESRIREAELPSVAASRGKKCLKRYGPIDLDTIGPVRSYQDWGESVGIEWVTARDIPAQLLLFVE